MLQKIYCLGRENPGSLGRQIGKLVIGATFLFICATGMAYSAPKTVLVLGDSLSAEFGLARGTGWVALLDQRLQQQKLNVTVINASISGETTSGAASRIADLLKRYQPGVVVIELGGNDGLRGLPIAAAEQNFNTIIAACQAAKAKPLLVGMQIPPNYGRSYTDKFTGMYSVVARENHIPLVPFLLEGVADQPALFQADRIHMVAAAHPHILDNVWTYLAPMISAH